MPESTGLDDQKQKLMLPFNTIASNYDALHFLHSPARRLVELAKLSTNARVLDVATGTGLVAMLAAQAVGQNGKVVGIDLAEEMLAVARQKFPPASHPQITFQTGDAENLNFPALSFEAVLSSAALFFVPDMLKALKEFRRVLVPGGCVGFNSFEAGFLQPLNALWIARLEKHALKIGSLPTHRLGGPAICEQFLREAGFTEIETHVEQLGYYLPGFTQRWDEIVPGLEGMPLLKITAEEREQIKAEHMAEVNAFVTPQGLWVDVPVIFAFGR